MLRKISEYYKFCQDVPNKILYLAQNLIFFNKRAIIINF